MLLFWYMVKDSHGTGLLLWVLAELLQAFADIAVVRYLVLEQGSPKVQVYCLVRAEGYLLGLDNYLVVSAE